MKTFNHFLFTILICLLLFFHFFGLINIFLVLMLIFSTIIYNFFQILYCCHNFSISVLTCCQKILFSSDVIILLL